jgi:hypothetical protein
MSLRVGFLGIDDALASHGVPPLSPWWRDGIGQWLDQYEAGGALELWGCAGRGSAKSTALYKLALFFAVFVPFEVPPGEMHFAIVLSRLKEEAAKGISIIGRWLTLLGIAHRPSGDVIEIGDGRGIRVVAASVSGASGWRAFFLALDEYAKWSTAGVDELNAGEVRTSAIAMSATHARAPVLTFGSAWGAFGEFYEAITGGTTSERVVLGPAPTWIAAPHITEESTRAKERVPQRWAREYECRFSASLTALWDEVQVDRIMSAREKTPDGKFRRMVQVSREVLVTDPSNLKKDAWTAALGAWWTYERDSRDMWLRTPYYEPRAPGGRGMRTERDAWGNTIPNPDWRAPEPFFLLREIKTYDKTFGRSGASLVAELAHFAREAGVADVISDQRDAMLLESEFARHRMRFTSLNYTNASKADALLWMSERIRTDSLRIDRHARMRDEMLSFREKILPSGTVTYEGLRHDDHVSLLLTSAIGDVEGCFRGSPTNKPGTTREVA